MAPTSYADQTAAADAPLKKAATARQFRNPKTYRPLARARRLSRRVARGRAIPPPQTCKPQPPAGQDGITGWFMYNCGGGVLLVPSPRCVGPECRGGPKDGTPVLGYTGELDAGSRGSFIQANRLIGTTAFDGVEIQRGLAAIDELRDLGSIDAYYAGAAKRAYLQRLGEEGERAAPFEEPTPAGRILAPSALGKRYKGIVGQDVGKSVEGACRCTPREPDAIDPVSGWLIYYVSGGVLLTTSKKCMAGDGRAPGFWANLWKQTLALARPAPPVPARPQLPPIEYGAPAPPAPSGPGPTPPSQRIVCYKIGVWPGGIIFEGTTCPAGWSPHPV